MDHQGTHRRHRHAITTLVRESENYLWPDVFAAERKAEIAEPEVVKVHPHRSSVPKDLWGHLIDGATQHIEVLIYSGMSLTEHPTL